MRDVLIVTGPVNASQLGADAIDWARETTIVHVGGAGIRSTDYARAAKEFWPGGDSENFRARVARRVGFEPHRIGVIWFSAGHGAVSQWLHAGAEAEVDLWMCLDGLYAGGVAKWAKKLVSAATRGKTGLLATASDSAPPGAPYRSGMGSWQQVLDESPQMVEASTAPTGFGDPQRVFRSRGAAVMFFPDVDHHHQVAEFGVPMLDAFAAGYPRWWSAFETGLMGRAALIMGGVLGAYALASVARRIR